MLHGMMHFGHGWWRWTRGTIAVILTGVLICDLLGDTSRMTTYYLKLPLGFVGEVHEVAPMVAMVLLLPTFIFISMWKRWDFEIVPWVLLLLPSAAVVFNAFG